MKHIFIFAISSLLLLSGNLIAQQDVPVVNKYKPEFAAAYAQYPQIPAGLLEAISYTNTRFDNVTGYAESCSGIPKAYGIMGLILDGKNYFRSNLKYISDLTGYSINEITENPAKEVIAYAKAFSIVSIKFNIQSAKPSDYTPVLIDLSEFPVSDKNNLGNDFAINSHLYAVYTFLNNHEFSSRYSFPEYNLDLKQIFGDNLKILSAPVVSFENNDIISNDGNKYTNSNKTACPDYNFSNCSWVTSPNYSSRSGTVITAIAMHTVQGSYSGCISWFQNTDAQASTHYVVRSSDGQLCQMVLESNKAWHVTTENPYTIGYEHEGYVDNASWYTVAMYQSSANLTRDICTDQNINRLRTFCRDTLDDGTALDYGLHSLGGDGSCIKIKGHQHFPNQTHTDPGPNWSWSYYYKLINQGTTPTIYTTDSGNFYDTGGSSANYGDDERKIWVIKPTNASTVTLSFSSFSLEANYDFLYIYDGDNEFAHLIGRYNTQSPGTITSTGNALCIEFRSDCATTATGWTASWTSTSVDNIAPTTSISTTGTWKTTDFTADFTDQDNAGGSGVEKSFYQVLEFDGTNWLANHDRGFFGDNFDNTISSDWSVYSGTWSINSNALYQSDEANSNTNIYAPLTQNLSNRYLFQFYAKIDGADANKRFGFHFFSDDANQDNRGNSYFVWFRLSSNTLEFYKCVNNSFTAAQSIVSNVVTTPGQWYDYKVIYDRISGKMDVYRDNVFLGSWTDPSPYSTGNYISFRSGNCQLWVNELKVYRSRYPSVTVTVGNDNSKDIRYQNPSPTTYGAKIKSIVNDANGNLSAIAYHDLNVDWTAPIDITTVNDGSGNDIDTISVSSSLSANWTATTDPNSGVAKYWYSIGTTAGSTDIKTWTDNGLNTTANVSGLSLNAGVTYYFNVKAENNAGLISNITSSDGQVLANSTSAGFITSATEVCVGDTVYFTNTSTDAVSYNWTLTGANPGTTTATNPFAIYNSPGTYDVELHAIGMIDSVVLLQPGLITVRPLPVAAFSVNDTLLYLPGALALFQNNSSEANTFVWNFGDGLSTSDFEPWHIYDTTGYFTVSLTATNDYCGSSTTTHTNYIHVVMQSVQSPVAGFTFNTNEICSGDTVYFTNASTNSDSYIWTFDGIDPSVSYELNPVVVFDSAGVFSVHLTAVNQYNTSTIDSMNIITVHPTPEINFTTTDTLIYLPNAIALFQNNTINADTYLWNFGDGATSADVSPWHLYSDTGYYTISLQAGNNYCDNSLTVYNMVHVDIVDAITRLSEIDVMVWPNPFKDDLYIKFNNTEPTSISLIDITGKEMFYIKDYTVTSDFIETNISPYIKNLAEGSYILKVTTGPKNSYYQLIKY